MTLNKSCNYADFKLGMPAHPPCKETAFFWNAGSRIYYGLFTAVVASLGAAVVSHIERRLAKALDRVLLRSRPAEFSSVRKSFNEVASSI